MYKIAAEKQLKKRKITFFYRF